MIPIPFIGPAVSWLIGSRLGRIVGLIIGALLFLKIVDWRAERRGAKKTKDYLEKKSNEAAQRRRETRDEIDLDAKRPGAADRLRKSWSRD